MSNAGDAISKTLLLEAKDLNFSYSLGDVVFPALSGINLNIAKGSFLCLSGPSGSGKSTLLNVLGLIEEPQSGELRFRGTPLTGLGDAEKNHIRRHELGFIFQFFHLFDFLTAEENVTYFKLALSEDEMEARVHGALKDVGLWEHRHKKPLQMSGGQKQRVAIARAIAKRPALILGDEPTASLDQKTGREVMALLAELNQDKDVTIVLSSHDPMVLSFVPDRVQILDGRIQS